MSRFSQMSKVELRARLSEIDRNIGSEEKRLISLQNSVLGLQDDHRVEAEAQMKPAHRLGVAAGLFAERQEAQRQRESLIGYREQAIDEIKHGLSMLEAERQQIKDVLAVRSMDRMQSIQR